MPHELEPAKVFDVNGSKYRVGLDEYGYVQIQEGRYLEGGDGEPEFRVYRSADWPREVQLDPETAVEVADYIKGLVE